jgi:hypothetical protein
MRERAGRWIVAASMIALVGCGSTAGSDVDAGAVDAHVVDAAAVDAGIDASRADTGAEVDTGAVLVDAGSDGGATDAGPSHPTDLDILVVGVLGPADTFTAILDDWGTVTTQTDPDLTLALLRTYDLVVFGIVSSSLGGTERSALGSWVSLEGGRVIVIGGQSTDRTTTHSITSALAMPLDLTATSDFTGTPTWYVGHVAGITIAAPSMHGGHNLGTGSDTRVHAEALGGSDLVVAARFESTTGGGRAYAWLDEAVTLDAFWNPDNDVFWLDVLTWVTAPP